MALSSLYLTSPIPIHDTCDCKNAKIVSETRAKWSQIGAVSESRGLPVTTIGPDHNINAIFHEICLI